MKAQNIGYDIKKYEVVIVYHTPNTFAAKVYAPDEISAEKIARQMFLDKFTPNCIFSSCMVQEYQEEG